MHCYRHKDGSKKNRKCQQKPLKERKREGERFVLSICMHIYMYTVKSHTHQVRYKYSMYTVRSHTHQVRYKYSMYTVRSHTHQVRYKYSMYTVRSHTHQVRYKYSMYTVKSHTHQVRYKYSMYTVRSHTHQVRYKYSMYIKYRVLAVTIGHTPTKSDINTVCPFMHTILHCKSFSLCTLYI